MIGEAENLATSVIASTVVCYRASKTRRRYLASAGTALAAQLEENAQPRKDWCVLSLNQRNMSSFDAVRGSSRYYSTSTIGTKSNSSSTNSVGRHSLSSGISPRSSKSSSLNVSPATSRNSLDSLRSGQQSLVHDDNDNVVANSSLNSSSSSRNSDNSHSKYRRALGNDAISFCFPS